MAPKMDEMNMEWIWPGYITRGEVTILAATPGRTPKRTFDLLAWPPSPDDAPGYTSPDEDDGAPLPDGAESDPDGADGEWAESSMDYMRAR